MRMWTAILLLVALLGCGIWALFTDRQGRWLLQAAWKNNLARVKLLVCLGTDVNYSIGAGSALHGAAYHGNIEMIDYLLKHGASVDQREKFDITPLWWARKNNQAEAEQLLLSHGANPDTSHINPP